MLKAVIFSLGMVASGTSLAAGPRCVEPENAGFVDVQLEFEVAGTGRLYFHDAPEDACRDKKLFIVPGDKVEVNKVAGPNDEWVKISYTAKNETTYSGWVRPDRLRFLSAAGTNMTPERLKYYTEAAAAAKKGKLGMP